MVHTHYRSEYSFVVPGCRKPLRIRVFRQAHSAEEAAAGARREAFDLAARHGASACAIRTTIEVGGVTRARAPEVNLGSRWRAAA